MYNFEEMDKRTVIFGYLFRVANRLQIRLDSEFSDLTAKQWFALAMLGFFDEPATLKALAKASDTSHQNMKQIVLKLEQKGFVRIMPDPLDRRALSITPTDKLAQWDEANQKTAKVFLDRMFKDFSQEEILTFYRALLKVYDNLQTVVGGNEDEG